MVRPLDLPLPIYRLVLYVFFFSGRSKLRELVAAKSRSSQLGGRRGLLSLRAAGRAPRRGHVLLRVRGLRLHSRVRRGSEKSAKVAAASHHPVAVHRVPRLLRRVVRSHLDDTVLLTGMTQACKISEYKCFNPYSVIEHHFECLKQNIDVDR